MNKVVLDSCVFSKLFLQEPDRQEAIELITELSQKNIQVLVPSLFLYEILSIATTSSFSIQDAYELIRQYQLANFEIIELDQQAILKAIEICEQGHKKSGFPSFYDASYHALAIINECQFITADKRHIVKAKQFGYITLLSDWKNVLSNLKPS